MNDFFDETSTGEKKVNKKKVIITVSIILFFTILVVLVSVYIANKSVRDWIDVHILRKEVLQDKVATIELKVDEQANAQVYAYDKHIAVLAKNKINLYNNSGKNEKELEVEINNAIFDSYNQYLGLAEKKGQKVYLIEGDKKVWESQVEGNISQIHLNKNGYMAVVIVDTSYKSVISLYDNTGNELFKTYLSDTRVADVSISEDNQYLALAEIDTSGTMIQSNVKVISIPKTQENSENAVEYIYNADANRLVSNIKYQENNNLVCLYQDAIDRIEKDENQSIVNWKDRKVTFATIELANHVAVVEERDAGLFSTNSEVQIMNTSNMKQSIYQVNQVAKEIYTKKDVIALNFGTEIHFINTSGWLIKKYVSNQEITNVVISDQIAGIVYHDKVDLIKL